MISSNDQKPRIISSAISLGAFSFFSMALGLASTILITRHFSAGDFGIYTLVIVFASFLTQISTFGLELSVSKFIAGAKDETSREHFFSTAVIFRLGTIFLTGILAWLGSPWLKMLFGQSLVPSFVFYIPLLFAVESFRALLRATLQGCLLFRKMGTADAIVSILNLLLLVIIYVANGDVALLIITRIVSSFAGSIFLLISIPIKKQLSFNVDAFKEMVKFGYPLQINDILGFIYSRIDTIFVAVFLGPAEIAIYEVARKIPDYLRNLYEPFKSVYYPFVSKSYSLDGTQKASSVMNDATRFVAFVTLFGTVIAVLFGQEIIQIIFSEKYLASVPVFKIFIFNLSIALISNVMGTTLVAIGDTKKPAVINLFNALASWIGSLLLIPVFALVGASIANTLGTAVAFPLNRYFLQKKIELKDISYLKPLLFFGTWVIFVFIIKPESFAMKLIFVIGFLLGCFLLSIITKKDITILLESSGIKPWFLVKKTGI